MSREYFDVAIVIPLEEELKEFRAQFQWKKDYSTNLYWRYEMDSPDPELRIIAVQAFEMGRPSSEKALRTITAEFDVGIVVVLGIAGALSKDLSLCDVCYTGEVLDVLDNAKASDGKATLKFFPKYYETPNTLTAALNFLRTRPNIEHIYLEWQQAQKLALQAEIAKLPASKGRDAISLLAEPKSMGGTIACGAVSESSDYNASLKDASRKVLAIETESGGVFDEAKTQGIPAIAIRGISDLAVGKADLEESTGGITRKFAAQNASSFLKAQLQNPYVKEFIVAKRQADQFQLAILQPSNSAPTQSSLVTIIDKIDNEIDAKLRDLSQDYRLITKGYKLPLPRAKHFKHGFISSKPTAQTQVEILDAIISHRVTLFSLDRNYPDDSLPWVIANELLTVVANQKQLIPIVVNGDEIKPPKHTLIYSAQTCVDGITTQSGIQPVFIIDGIPLANPTKKDFLIKEFRANPDARFVFITKNQADLINDGDFLVTTGAETFEITNISFLQLTNFVRLNFDMTEIQSEVISLKLSKTFERFNLSAHPTYFAGISKDRLEKLLQANRRSELIQLATDGFLSFVVAGDTAKIQLNRTTRTTFLRKLAVKLNVEKISFTQSEIIEYTRNFAEIYDFDINPLSFINDFVSKGILTFYNEKVRFALPFIEKYLLATALSKENELAKNYFQMIDEFDEATFDLYCEIGPDKEIVALLLKRLDASIAKYDIDDAKNILMTDKVRPAWISQPARLAALEKRLENAVAEVHSGKGGGTKKQKLLDTAEEVRDKVGQAKDEIKDNVTKSDPEIESLKEAISDWYLAIILLGSGSEHLIKDIKIDLAKRIVTLASHLLHHLTKQMLDFPFSAITNKLISDAEFVQKLADNDSASSLEDAKKLITTLIEILEFATVSWPHRFITMHLCESAHHKVLSRTLENTTVDGKLANVIKGIWLIDIDAEVGEKALEKALKSLPKSYFVQMNIATHLITRVYWSQAESKDRLAILRAAKNAIANLGLHLQTEELTRQLGKESKKGGRRSQK